MIIVLKPGRQSSVQDMGRVGYRHLGVGLSGAMDRLSLAVGNVLVGNPPDAAGLELVFPPVRLRFESACAIALTGADCPALLGQAPVGSGRRIAVGAGQTLHLAAARDGIRAYLCVSGGIDVPPVLGSRSTDLQARLGGVGGRALRQGDELAIAPRSDPATRNEAQRNDADPIAAKPFAALLPEMKGVLRITPGPEFDEFDAAARTALLQSAWTVTPQSNRMGCRLLGETLRRSTARQLNSHAVFPGLIQVPPGGAPIVLMAEAQTTGGYPRIASVIDADLWRLAQVPPGGKISFELATRAQAQQAWQKQQRYLRLLQEGLNDHRSERRSR